MSMSDDFEESKCLHSVGGMVFGVNISLVICVMQKLPIFFK